MLLFSYEIERFPSPEGRGKNMNDFYEIMNFYGFDLEKANAIAKEYPPVLYSPELMSAIMEESCVDFDEHKSMSPLPR